MKPQMNPQKKSEESNPDKNNTYHGLKIDTHTYLGKAENFGINKDTFHYFKDPRYLNTRFFAIPFHSSKNSEVIKRVQENSMFLGSYLIFNPNPSHPKLPQFGTDLSGELEKLAKEDYVIGIKTIPSIVHVAMDDEKLFPYYELAIKNGLAVLLHFSATDNEFTSPEKVDNVYRIFPELMLIAAHAGGKSKKEIAQQICKYTYFYFNTTAIDPFHNKVQVSNQQFNREDKGKKKDSENMSEVIETFMDAYRNAPSKILHGTDLGYYPPEDCYDWPVDLLPVEGQKKIFLDNALKLFGKRMKPIG